MIETKDLEDHGAVVFVHILKTGGSTLKRILASQYGDEEAYFINPPFDDSIVTEFLTLPEERRKKLKLIAGHGSQGLVKYMEPPFIIYALFRNPIDQLVSYYYYAKKTPTNHYYERLNAGMDIVQFSSELVAYNLQSRAMELLLEKEDRMKLDLILELIKGGRVKFGLLEQFDESILMLARELGWKKPPYYTSWLNVNKSRPAVEELPPDVARRLKEINHNDVELYKVAREIFTEELSVQGAGFAEEVAKFKVENLRRQQAASVR
ncbi:MAG: sulfotransferase family 2 domain-containing protein [Thermodesulfobacteriota bacterium]